MIRKEPGWWVCTQYKSHEFLEDHESDRVQDMTAGRTVPRLIKPPPEPTPGYWLNKIGIKAPLPAVRQASSSTDGTMCQAVGEIKPTGGGGGSGRRRKKKTVKPEPWYRQTFQ